MKRILLIALSLTMIVLAGCNTASPTPAASPTPVPPTPAPPTATPAPPPSATPTTGDGTEPGGVEVALTLIIIPDQEAIAIVDGEEIPTLSYREELNRALTMVTQSYMVDWNDQENQSLLPSFQEQVLDQVIQRTLMRQIAEQEGIAIDPEEVDAEIAELQIQIQTSDVFADWDSFLAENGLTEESIRPMISDSLLTNALIERYGGPNTAEHVHASHILVETEETGQEVVGKLNAGEVFGDLAAEYSMDPGSKDQGGDLGWFPRGVMVPEFEEAAFSLEPGEVSDLVQTDFGYHIIQVHKKEERELDPALLSELQQQRFQTWFDEQQAEKSVERLYTFETSG